MRLTILIILFAIVSSSAVSQLDQFEQEITMFSESLGADASLFDEFDAMGIDMDAVQIDKTLTKSADVAPPTDQPIRRAIAAAIDKRVKDPERAAKLREALDRKDPQSALQNQKEIRDPKPPTRQLPPKSKEMINNPVRLPIKALAVILLLFAVIFFVIVYKYLKRSKREKKLVSKAESDIAKLEQQMQKQNEELDLAKEKYHKRELDEESFKAIVKDNQQRLIKLEVEMKSIRRKVKKIT